MFAQGMVPPKKPPPPPARGLPAALALRQPTELRRDPLKNKALYDKDPWGYQFAQPLWRLEGETMKRAPEDHERERVCAMLSRELQLDPKTLKAGLTGEALHWTPLLKDKDPRRRQFAEWVRELCSKSRGGKLGVWATHQLAHEAGLLSTVHITAQRAGFPLKLTLEEPVSKRRFAPQYALHLDRVFYPIFALPKKSRFNDPIGLVDAYRLLDAGYESVVRRTSGELLLAISGKANAESADPKQARFEWNVSGADQAFTLTEATARVPGFELRDSSGALVGSLVNEAQGSPPVAIAATLRIDEPGPALPWLGLAVAYFDAWVQRQRGVLGRSAQQAEEVARHLQEQAQEEEAQGRRDAERLNRK